MDKRQAAAALRVVMGSNLDPQAKAKLALFLAGSLMPDEINEIAADVEDDDEDRALNEQIRQEIRAVFQGGIDRLNAITQEEWDRAE